MMPLSLLGGFQEPSQNAQRGLLNMAGILPGPGIGVLNGMQPQVAPGSTQRPQPMGTGSLNQGPGFQVNPQAAVAEPSVAFRNALLAGGQAAATAPAYDSVGSSLLSALANGITSGAQTFVATKDAEKDRAAQMAQLQAMRQSIAGLPIPEDQKAYLMALPPAEAAKLIAPMLAPKPGPEYAYGDKLGTYNKATGEVKTAVAPDAPKAPEPENKPDSNVQAIMSTMYPGKTLAELDGPTRARVLKLAEDYRRSGATNLPGPQDPTAKALEGGLVDEIKTQKPLMQKVASSLTGLEHARDLLATGKVNTGIFSAAKQLYSRLTKDGSAAITQEYINTVINGVLPQLKPMLGGNFSRAEFEVFIKSGGGSPSDQLAAMQNIINARIAAAHSDLDAYDATLAPFAEKCPALAKQYQVKRPGKKGPSSDFSTWQKQNGGG